MAASRPRDAHLKEKSSSASSVPHHTETGLYGRRTTRPSVPGTPDRDLRRKPTVSKSTTGISRARSQSPSDATAGRRVPARKPNEKPPSPSGPPRRGVATPSTLKGKTVKVSSSLPSAAISSKPALDKASKPLKGTRTQPSARTKSLVADPRTVPSSPAPNTTDAPPAMKSDQEEEIEIQVEKSEPVDIPELKDDAPDELDLITDSSEPNITEDTTDSASQTDQHELSSPKAEIEIATTNDEGLGGDGNKSDEDRESPKEAEEKPAIESYEELKIEPAVDGGKPEEAEVDKATTVESSQTKGPEVVVFKRPEAAATARKKDAPRSNDVIEEARSKLMEKRKSKVLALVGAFETVISNREPEGPSGQTQGKSGDEEA